MKNDTYDNSVIATATNTSKSENQDSKSEFEEENFKAFFIADGLGSFKYAQLASKRITDFFKEKSAMLRSSSTNDGQNFNEVFKLAKQKLIDFSDEFLKEDEKNEENLFGTTAIATYETEDKISIAYVGNGAIWHIRGNFNEFPASYHFPWNVINYLNPHTIPENGKEALYRLISNSTDFNECIPSTIEITKDKFIGEIIMICTDGIYSADQLKAGKNDKGIWIKYETSMLKFFEYLTHFFKENQNYSKESIEQMLNQYLEELKPTLDDDATIGILMTKEVLNYQNKINWLNKNEINSANEI